jgi:hypothetical protein
MRGSDFLLKAELQPRTALPRNGFVHYKTIVRRGFRELGLLSTDAFA